MKPRPTLLGEAIAASERAANLTRQLLAYAGKGQFVVEAIDINAMIEELGVLVRSSLPKNVVLHLDLEEPLPFIKGDSPGATADHEPGDQRRRSNSGRPARLGDGHHPEPGGRRAYLTALGSHEIAPGSYVAMGVHAGVGMDEDTIARIFDPFFTTKFTGRGLGLAAAMGIVRGHKGMLKVSSIPGRGTTFKVLLPSGGPQPGRRRRRIGTPASRAGARCWWLTMSPSCAKSRPPVYGVRLWGDRRRERPGRRGSFRELHSELAIVVLDLTMPVMSGEEALDACIPSIRTSPWSSAADTTKRTPSGGLPAKNSGLHSEALQGGGPGRKDRDHRAVSTEALGLPGYRNSTDLFSRRTNPALLRAGCFEMPAGANQNPFGSLGAFSRSQRIARSPVGGTDGLPAFVEVHSSDAFTPSTSSVAS